MLFAILVKINVSSYLFVIYKFPRDTVKLLCLSLGLKQGLLFPSLLLKKQVTWQRSDEKLVIKQGPRLNACIHQVWHFGLNYLGFKAKTLSLNLNVHWKDERRRVLQARSSSRGLYPRSYWGIFLQIKIWKGHRMLGPTMGSVSLLLSQQWPGEHRSTRILCCLLLRWSLSFQLHRPVII